MMWGMRREEEAKNQEHHNDWMYVFEAKCNILKIINGGYNIVWARHHNASKWNDFFFLLLLFLNIFLFPPFQLNCWKLGASKVNCANIFQLYEGILENWAQLLFGKHSNSIFSHLFNEIKWAFRRYFRKNTFDKILTHFVFVCHSMPFKSCFLPFIVILLR